MRMGIICPAAEYPRLYQAAAIGGTAVMHADSPDALARSFGAAKAPEIVVWLAHNWNGNDWRVILRLCGAYPRLRVVCLTDEPSVAWTTAREERIIVLPSAADGESIRRTLTALAECSALPAVGSAPEDSAERPLALAPGLVFDPALRSVINNGVVHPLPGKELEMLCFLLRRRGRFVSTEELLRGLWDEYTGSDMPRQYIYRLRGKLRTEKAPFGLLLHARGLGYMLVPAYDSAALQLAKRYGARSGKQSREARRKVPYTGDRRSNYREVEL
ncbi:hypothetical protein YDYSG_43040 [Paenibacillus tyrfis]|uniref:winged helix-turn-helix domain-containing protein n=1 Tax=Paenibacillus tyrfis TaxID=1501230 RepID=UPI0024902545|nr:winged helix-turn-helix domain-containing protein [Paenibacillus tyrfis]GLI08274.1 hypothetical protein YDYSG_43040 [Paenibacillus tyrfis]